MRCRLALAGLALLLSAAPASGSSCMDPRVVVEDLLTASGIEPKLMRVLARSFLGLDDLDAMGEGF